MERNLPRGGKKLIPWWNGMGKARKVLKKQSGEISY
jgi:streptomycin 6-kinase|nr:MAG TPA: hypothetical protein [Caudoviricetes sp.]